MTRPLPPFATGAFAAATLLFMCSAAHSATGPGYIWWEGEKPAKTNFPAPDDHPYVPHDAEQAGALSGGAWIGVNGADDYFLEYTVEVPEAGEYGFYVRKFWKHGPFRWRFNDQEWREVGRDIALMDSVGLRLHLGANWIAAGGVTLDAGKHTLRIELLRPDPATKVVAAFDAFVLTRGAFTARGKLKPDQRDTRAMDGWFSWDPPTDTFGESPIDLSHLNSKPSGVTGRIIARDGGFVFEKTGEPMRIWGVNLGPDQTSLDHASVDALVKGLAKRGVNCLRLHGPIAERVSPRVLKKDYIDSVKYLVSAARREGIYVLASIYFPLWFEFDETSGFEGYVKKGQDGHRPFALLYFNEDFQAIYRDWWRELLRSENPYTGIPLVEDPTLAFCELVNEDSYFFWTFRQESIPPAQFNVLRAQFGSWLAKKYGSIDAALDAWAKAAGERLSLRGDKPAEGRIDFIDVGQLVGGAGLRAQDTAQFLLQSQREFYAVSMAYLRDELGFRGLIHSSNWKTASDRYLEPLEMLTYADADFIDRHGYFGGTHKGEGASFSVRAGHTFEDRSLVRPRDGKKGPSFGSPLVDYQYNNLPSTISEIGWTEPGAHRAEMPLLSAALGALQQSDGFFFFAVSGASWQNSIIKFPVQTPTTLGQFPAAALIYRKGYIAPGENVADVRLGIDALKALEGGPIEAPQNLDALRAADVPLGGSIEAKPAETGLDPLAPYVGRVDVRFIEGSKSSMKVRDLSPFVDRAKKIVRSSNGQITWHYGRGMFLVDAPKAQGATGFFADFGPVNLGDLDIALKNDYASLILVPLDDEPLASSRRMLLQVMTQDRPFGWATEPAADGLQKITNLGGPPYNVRLIRGQVRFRGPVKITALDENGYPAGAIPVTEGRAELKPDRVYYLVER